MEIQQNPKVAENLYNSINYLKCTKKDHKNMELKFILESQVPDIEELFCTMCLKEKTSDGKQKIPEINNLQTIFSDILKSSKKL